APASVTSAACTENGISRTARVVRACSVFIAPPFLYFNRLHFFLSQYTAETVATHVPTVVACSSMSATAAGTLENAPKVNHAGTAVPAVTVAVESVAPFV